MKTQLLLLVFAITIAFQAQAKKPDFKKSAAAIAAEKEDALDFNPHAKDALEKLQNMDREYEADTNLNAFINKASFLDFTESDSCYRIECHVFIDVQRSKQELNLYVDGKLVLTTKTSTGRAGFGTPNFDTNPNGRIYQIYSSTKYPGYNNMPFAIFISGGFAIHGAPGSEDKQLGRPASHGCVRVRTSVAQEINKIVSKAAKEAGGSMKGIWITVRS